MEFSSNKTSPDVAQGFIKHLLRSLQLLYKNKGKLSPSWFGVPTGCLPEINHRTRHRTLPVQLVTMKPPLILTHMFLVYKIAHTPRSVAFQTVHDRGLGYSNRFTLCRGGALSPHQIGHRRGSSHGLPDDNTSNVGTLIKTFHYVHANKKVPLQLGGFPTAPFDPHHRHQTATARDLTVATGSNLIHTVFAPLS